jgi:multidrug efflux pump subunit AcrA (membrane-fusion protein)
MHAQVRIVLAEARDAVLIPEKALIERDDKTWVRASANEKGPFEEREVETGVSDGTNVAIVRGLAEGEFVVLP